jgi:hypothetical protein
MVAALSVVDLLTSDTHSRLYGSFTYLRNVSLFFTFVLKSLQRRIGISASISMKYGANIVEVKFYCI